MKKGLLGVAILITCMFLVGCKKSEPVSIVNSKLNSEIQNTIQFAIKNDVELVAIDRDGKQVVIFDNEKTDYREFYYFYDNDSSTMYLSLLNGNKNDIGKIDLTEGNGKYELELLTSFNSSGYFPASIVKIKDTLYFADETLYSYNEEEGKVVKANISGNNRTMAIVTVNDLIFYQTTKGVYSYNPETKEVTQICNTGSTSFGYKDLFIYYYEGGANGKYDDNKDLSYYAYDTKTGKSTRISKLYGAQSMGDEFVVPVGDSFYSIGNRSINIFDGEKFGETFEFNCNTLSNVIGNCTDYDIGYAHKIIRLSDNTLLIGLGDDGLGEPEPFYVTFNIDTKKVSLTNSDKYNYIQYIL